MYAPNVERWVAVKGKTLLCGLSVPSAEDIQSRSESDLGEVFGKMVQK